MFASSLDPDANRLVEAEDIVRVLARVSAPGFTYAKKVTASPGLTSPCLELSPSYAAQVDGEWTEVPFDCEKAHAIAIAILRDQAGASAEDASMHSFSFADYMGTQVTLPDLTGLAKT